MFYKMTQVQDSSDCCINSKFSCTQKGYFEDEYLSLFIKKLHLRSPIINRGYYIRFKVIEEVFLHWHSLLNNCTYKKCQIISLGAGYDSSYLRLKKCKKLPHNCHYIEIDFPNVLRKKLESIKKSPCFQEIIASEKLSSDPTIVFHCNEYSMLGFDLTDSSSLQKYFNSIGVNFDVPTLFLSECSITYIDSKKSEDLIVWIQRNFPHSVFVAYEQVYPFDAFGLIMRKHFIQVGCTLKSILTYPDEDTQVQRFKKLKWPQCIAFTMYDFFMSLPEEEKIRIKNLDVFDEYEMWHEKCHHYVLIWASQGNILSNPFLSIKSCSQLFKQNLIVQKAFNWKYVTTTEVTSRFGHQVIPLSPVLLVLSGGFGLSSKKHQKLGDITLYHTEEKKHLIMHFIEPRMFHSMTKLSNNTAVMIGGRSSPKKVFRDILLIDFSSLNSEVIDKDDVEFDNFKCSSLLPKRFLDSLSICPQSIPVPTWRHSASVVFVDGIEYVVVFGGCSVDCVPTNKCFVANTKTWIWSEIEIQAWTPLARHSHSAVTYQDSYVIVTGGLSANETILRSVHMLNCNNHEWSTLEISGLLPRYSHTSHVWNNRLFLVGGITLTSYHKLGMSVINMESLKAIEILPPGQNPEYPILLSNHSSYLSDGEIIVIGGGGNCFSFGTHFNKKIVLIDIKSFL